MKINAAKVRMLMAQNMMSLSDLQRETKLAYSTLGKILNGSNARPKTVGILAKVFNIDVEELVVSDNKVVVLED